MGGGGGPAYDGAKAIGDVSLEGVMNMNGPRPTTTPIPFIDNPGGSKTSVTNCREFVFNAARSPNNCMSVRQKDIVAGMVILVIVQSFFLTVDHCNRDSPPTGIVFN